MSRRRRQDNRGWIDEGPRSPGPGPSVTWPLAAHQGVSPASRARARDVSEGEYRDYALRELETVS